MVDFNVPSLSPEVSDLPKLLTILPMHLQQALERHPDYHQLIEVILDLGRLPEARFPQKAEFLSDQVIRRSDLDYCIERVGQFSGDNRAGIERTLHRISAIRNRQHEIIGLTCRVGRSVFGTTSMIRDLVESGRSILMLGRPGVGKTTALRDVARVLADELDKRVVIIDTSNEIAGDGDIPHPAIGRARRMQVARPELQHQVMIEAVENHMPEVIVIDEIGTELEALAARTIAERGVQLIGTAHGNQIENLVKNPTLSDLVGGIQSVTLGDDEARRRGSQKSILERKAPPTFDIAVELTERYRWVVHQEVAETVDLLLRGRQPHPQIRSLDKSGKLVVENPAPAPAPVAAEDRVTPLSLAGWQMSGRMTPVSAAYRASSSDASQFQQMLEDSFQERDRFGNRAHQSGPNGEDLPLHVYPYAVSRSQLDQVITSLNLPIVLTKDLEHTDVIFALRSNIKHHGKLRQIARNRQIPIHTIKSSSMPNIARGLRRLLNMEEPGKSELIDFQLMTTGKEHDELEALEEARLAVEQIVIPKGQPVELLPRPANVRKMQHELIEHYRLQSRSFGDEPNRRLRIYPA
ncbi:R3H domain-containing nucleic acid-binding protein [Lyngbya confervoides]|uniref:AAA family ATPase n=1 Tax=Lyngbya confervoides BDU141951 TaxID=1574623 RepID=A0ABD4T3J3_9CYAN|nr:R3H domain-containing nucleic acid-binding protein [Lyngbya confervoides]MCM1982885.1 AAA family ATPase [Lyngbya confervoides BDU141951]